MPANSKPTFEQALKLIAEVLEAKPEDIASAIKKASRLREDGAGIPLKDFAGRKVSVTCEFLSPSDPYPQYNIELGSSYSRLLISRFSYYVGENRAEQSQIFAKKVNGHKPSPLNSQGNNTARRAMWH